MPWPEALEPMRMQRVALVAPAPQLRAVLVEVADAGTLEIDRGADESSTTQPEGEARRLLRQLHPDPVERPTLALSRPDPGTLVAERRFDLLAGEAELEAYTGGALTRDDVSALAGWVPAAGLGELVRRVAPVGGGVVQMPTQRGVDPPTLLRPDGELRTAFAPLVATYATVPYVDVDPTLLAGMAYVLMFGIMFGDAGHGALLVAVALLLRAGRPRRFARWARVWSFVLGAGLAAIVAGLLYGEFFGPTGVIPVLWVAPLTEPVALLAAALGLGCVLLGGAYVVGTVNRWREGRWPLALVAPSGIAGAALFAGVGLVVLGAVSGTGWVTAAGVLGATTGMVLAYVGFLAAAGGGAAGAAQAAVELVDSVIRLGANVVSFSRLAAFGLTHAALGLVVWDGTTTLWARGGLLMVAAVAVFAVGNAIAFTLEALVAGIQALRLEYYELFSRVFSFEGRPFRPWHLPVDRSATTDRPHRDGASLGVTGRKP
jgi:V/A-type H+-transporting ATPase subunit I